MTATHEELCQRAYSLWKERGCPDGSPEVDWYRAEAELTEPGDSQPELEAAAPASAAAKRESGKGRAPTGAAR